jgi:hypothetical protein
MGTAISQKSGDWSDNTVWSGGGGGSGEPVGGDDVQIQAAHTVALDVDLINTLLSALADITIDGVLEPDLITQDVSIWLATGGEIHGSGTWNICGNTTVDDYPAVNTWTNQLDGTANINGSEGLTLNFRCVEPTIKYVTLTNAENIGDSVLEYTGSDVSSDATRPWVVGDDIAIVDSCETTATEDVEFHTIQAVSDTSITITGTLAKAKVAGAHIVLLSRNIKINGSNNSGQYLFQAVQGGPNTIRAEICGNGNGRGFQACYPDLTIGGVIWDVVYGFSSTHGIDMDGLVMLPRESTATDYGFANCFAGYHIDSLHFGYDYVYYNHINCHIENPYFYGNSFPLFSPRNITIEGGEIKDCYYAFSQGINVIASNMAISNVYYFVHYPFGLKFYNTTLTNVNIELQLYNYRIMTSYLPLYAHYDYDGVAGDFKSATRGGITISVDGTEELLTNGDMELDANWSTFSGSSAEQSTTQKHGGTYSWKFTPTSTYDGIYNDTIVATVNSKSYRVGFWVYPDDTTTVSYSMKNGSGAFIVENVAVTGLTQDAWNYVTFDFTENAGGLSNTIIFNSGLETSGDWYIDDVTITCLSNVPPTGHEKIFEHQCEDADEYCFRQEETIVEPGETLEVVGKIRIADAADHSSYPPRLDIIDYFADPLWGQGDAELATDQVDTADGTDADWQDVSVSWQNTGDLPRKVLIRVTASHATGDVDECWNIQGNEATNITLEDNQVDLV